VTSLPEEGRPIQVAMVTSLLSQQGGGIPAAIMPLAQALIGAEAEAFRVTLLSADLPDDSAIRQVAQTIAGFGLGSLRVMPGLVRALEAGACDIVHTHGLWTWPSIAAETWRRRTGRATIVSPHGMLDPWALANSGWKKQLALATFERAHLSGARCIHALNDSEAASIRAAGFVNPLAVIPNGIDMPNVLVHRAPTKWSSDGRKVLLFLGRLHPKKGVDRLIQAWARLRSDTPALARSWRLVIAGWDDGGHLPELLRLSTNLGCGENISFPGPVFGPAKAAAYASADAFVLPSLSEGLPTTVLEAWSYAVPVFATAACNLPEGLAQGAIIQIPAEPEGIGSVLSSALNDHARLAAVGEAGRRLVGKDFAWPRIAKTWRTVYQWAARAGPAPDCLYRG
jgi:glycosyltransferase involved in cell wall biosynthesis